MNSDLYERHVERLKSQVNSVEKWSAAGAKQKVPEPSPTGEVAPRMRSAVVEGARLLRSMCDACQDLQFDLWKANPAIQENPSIDTEVLNAVAEEVAEVAETCGKDAEGLSQYHAARSLLVLHRPVRKRTLEATKRDVELSVQDMDEHGWWNVRRTVVTCQMRLDALVTSLQKNRDRVLAGGNTKSNAEMLVM